MHSAQPSRIHVGQYHSELFLWASHCVGTTGLSGCLEVNVTTSFSELRKEFLGIFSTSPSGGVNLFLHLEQRKEPSVSLVAEICCFRHRRQNEWRHGRARGSLYSSRHMPHSSTEATSWSRSLLAMVGTASVPSGKTQEGLFGGTKWRWFSLGLSVRDCVRSVWWL